MGELADYYTDRNIQRHVDLDFPELRERDEEGMLLRNLTTHWASKRHETIWTTANGTKIPFSELTDSHLRNCINMGIRNGANTSLLEFELEFRKTQ